MPDPIPLKWIFMVAAENGGLPGGKIGGMGDVIRDLPRALARRGHRVSVLTPSYGFLARTPAAKPIGTVPVRFAGVPESCRWLEVASGTEGVDYYLLDSPRFSPGGDERIYHTDESSAPYATDAAKFAFFCAAAAALVSQLPETPDILHLHDWHLGLMLLLRGYDDHYRALKPIRSVFTIHNLALQGTRPLDGAESSLSRWFPELKYPAEIVADPQFPDCVNPMAVGIRLADALNTVSPTYAAEILQPADASRGTRGGEGLEGLLAARDREGVLFGILNGIDYSDTAPVEPTWAELVALMREEVLGWIAAGRFVDSGAWLAERRIGTLPARRPAVVATSVGRVTEQKLKLLREPIGRTAQALDRVLAALDPGMLILLGSGDAEYERFLQGAMVRHSNLVFLKGYSDRLARALYAAGDIFLMPSVFEPCGISQMLAMSAGQPCVAHAVGGLKDTVTAANGFPFDGATPWQQAQNLVRTVAAAVSTKLGRPEKWLALTNAARAERFSWDLSASRYVSEVYGF